MQVKAADLGSRAVCFLLLSLEGAGVSWASSSPKILSTSICAKQYAILKQESV